VEASDNEIMVTATLVFKKSMKVISWWCLLEIPTATILAEAPI